MFLMALVLAFATKPAASDQAAIFTAAGFHRQGDHWQSECDDPGTPSYEPGKIEQYADLNGDGRPEAIVTEGGTYCYGNTGTGFTLLTRSGAGKWSKLYQSQGVATVLKTRANGWPEIEVGGPGFCFPVLRWSGKAYAIQRHAYEGKACKP